MSTTAEHSPAPYRWSNTSILLLSAALLGLLLAIHPLWNAAISKAATDGLQNSQAWFITVRHVCFFALLPTSIFVVLTSLFNFREQFRPLFLLPATLGIGLLVTPMWGSALPESTSARSDLIERLIALRKEGQPSSAEPQVLNALITQDKVAIRSAVLSLYPADTKRLIQLQSSMGMDSQALKAKGFAEHSDVEAAVNFSREHEVPKAIQAELYSLLAQTSPPDPHR